VGVAADLDKPADSALWMKDGKPVKEQAGKFKLITSGTRVSLDISNVSQTDSGQYAVIVANQKGENKAAFSVNVH